ncbi:aspartate aminotransferase family protein [Acuticoccus sp. MNP-M23]|uniref:aspartate aminotransferase family protein n=1 Tax=Acuticoccus sp. MNP-M23 TaxID=3072793 RepID=UPI002814D074|nr:aspartate aminotransferase family protein [Acuticoccus sp. MNP-M23]WMS44254.1 aspartate aminotransferase family protein [Acuticoccus sp. MNP-M23]
MPSPSAHIFQRATAASLPVAVGGDGVYVITRDGRRILDGCGGAAVSCLGHSDRGVTDAIKRQVDDLPYAHTGFFTSEPAEELADMLIARAPEGIGRVYFVSGGSEAAEAAIKLARQYFLEKGEPARSRIIARRQSYHGNTLGALAAGGNEWRRRQFAPLLSDAFSHIAPCHHWRWGEPGESAEAYGTRVADELDAEIQRLGPETVAAFMAEPVVGATMGAVPAVPGYFARVREICDRYGVLLILDEVMCGMGRTGTLFASEADDVRPDMVLIAKGLGAGYQPIGATLVAEKIHQTIADGSGFFQHGHTYMGHPTACAAGVAVLNTIESRDLLANVNAMGDRLRQSLEARFGQHPNVGDIRGRGLFMGVELVADRDSCAPLPTEAKTHAKIKRAAFERDLMVYPMGGTIDGAAGDHILIAPPFIASADDIDTLVDRLGQAVDDVLGRG